MFVRTWCLISSDFKRRATVTRSKKHLALYSRAIQEHNRSIAYHASEKDHASHGEPARVSEKTNVSCSGQGHYDHHRDQYDKNVSIQVPVPFETRIQIKNLRF